jgi:hypothetical protein
MSVEAKIRTVIFKIANYVCKNNDLTEFNYSKIVEGNICVRIKWFSTFGFKK